MMVTQQALNTLLLHIIIPKGVMQWRRKKAVQGTVQGSALFHVKGVLSHFSNLGYHHTLPINSLSSHRRVLCVSL